RFLIPGVGPLPDPLLRRRSGLLFRKIPPPVPHRNLRRRGGRLRKILRRQILERGVRSLREQRQALLPVAFDEAFVLAQNETARGVVRRPGEALPSLLQLLRPRLHV